jgi:hypothetical protein
MRRLCLILLVSATVVPVALAAPRAAGDGTFAGKNIDGFVKITGRGALWGQIDNGKLTVADPDPTDGPAPKVSGYTDTELTPTGTQYSGKNLHFQIPGGKYVVYLSGTGVDFSAVGQGKALVDGFDKYLNPGKYEVGDDSWQTVPYIPTSIVFPAVPTP